MQQGQKDKLLKIVKDNYREIAAQFDLSRKKYLWPELSKVSSAVPEGASILDAGCGNGRLIESFLDKKIDYLGVDNSRELIELAKINYPGYNFLVCDILNLESLKIKSDFVFSIAVLHHLPGFDLRLRALQQLLVSAKSGGTIVFSVWKMWNNKKYRFLLIRGALKKIAGLSSLDFGDLIFKWKNNKGEPVSERYYHAFTARELKKLLRSAGVSGYDIHSDKHNYWVTIKNH